MGKINIKTKREIATMREGGAKLARVKKALKSAVGEGVRASEIEALADRLIKEEGAAASFKKVPGYQWATCVNVNEGVVHGIPHKSIVFKEGDLVSVDVGLYYKSFHTDTSFSVLVGVDPKRSRMLEVGKQALKAAIKQAKIGKSVGDISAEMEKTLKKGGYNPIQALVGHGVGRDLHEEPMIPCFVSGSHHERVRLEEGMVLAIEVMYAEGDPAIKLASDGWTLSTKDGKMAALFEETVALTGRGPVVLTD